MFSKVKIRDGHDNFFTPLRIVFALMVVFGHAFNIALRNLEAEPYLFFHYKPSYLAVNLFFIASGFLVTKSMLYRKDIAEFTAARTLRIYPALIAYVLFVMFIMGPFVTNLPFMQFIKDPQFWTQPFKVLSFYSTDMVMPGALLTNDEQLASAPLWTLRYEVLAYIGTAILFSLGFLKKNWMIIAQFAICAAMWPLAHLTGLYDQIPAAAQALLRFGLCYTLGGMVYALQERLSFHIIGIIILGAFAALFNGTVVFEIVTNIWLAYIIFWAAYVKIPALNGLKKLSDTSYGIYIYHWAIMQWLFYAHPGLNLWQLTSLGVVLTVLAASLSWRYVEKPMLKRKKTFGIFLKNLFGQSKRKLPTQPIIK